MLNLTKQTIKDEEKPSLISSIILRKLRIRQKNCFHIKKRVQDPGIEQSETFELIMMLYLLALQLQKVMCQT